MLPKNIPELLESTAQNFAGKGLHFYEEGLDRPPVFVSYEELLQKANTNARRLLRHGIVEAGKPVLVYFENTYRNILWSWSIIIAGGVPAIMPPMPQDDTARSASLENMGHLFAPAPIVLTESGAKHHFCSASSHRFIPGSEVYTVEEVSDILQTEMPMDETFLPGSTADSGSLATLLFTSGSTGHSKAVRFTHKQLIQSVVSKQADNSVTPETRFMSWTTFDHSVNFCELHLNAMYSGANQLHVRAADLVCDPARFWKFLSQEKIGYTFAPNSFLAVATRALVAQEPLGLDFSKLQILFAGGEANKLATLEAADKLVRRHGAPPHSIVSVYGLSETCSACFYNKQIPEYDIEHGNVFASVGKHLTDGIELRIVDDSGVPQPLGTAGHIQLKGEIIFEGYYNNEAATTECWTKDGWFHTGDLGHRNPDGNLVIAGRSKELVIINGQKYSSLEIEHAIETSNTQNLVPSYTATFSSWDPNGDSEAIVVLFAPPEELSQWYNLEELRKACQKINSSVVKFLSKPAMDIIPLPRSELPKSTIGKLSRAKLKKSYESGRFNRYKLPTLKVEVVDRATPSYETETQKVLAELLSKESTQPLSTIHPETDMFSFGMDSMPYMRLKAALEQELGLEKGRIPMAILLRGTNVREVAALVDELSEGEEKAPFDPLVTLRATGSKTPLFFLPPGGGEVWNWMPMLKFVEDRPIYALRIRGLDDGDAVFDSMEELVDCFEAAIRRVQPEGPYAFLGLCFGSIPAFELCKRFNASPSGAVPSGDKKPGGFFGSQFGQKIGRFFYPRKANPVVFCAGIDCPPFVHEMVAKTTLQNFILELCANHKLLEFSEIPALAEKINAQMEARIAGRDFKHPHPRLVLETGSESLASQHLEPCAMSGPGFLAWPNTHPDAASSASSFLETDSEAESHSSATSMTGSQELESKPSTTAAASGSENLFITLVMDHFGAETLARLNLTREGMLGWWKVLNSIVEFVKVYRPSGQVACMDVFVAKEQVLAEGPGWMDRLRKWQGFVECNGLKMWDVEGTHQNVLAENAEGFARALNRALILRGA